MLTHNKYSLMTASTLGDRSSETLNIFLRDKPNQGFTQKVWYHKDKSRHAHWEGMDKCVLGLGRHLSDQKTHGVRGRNRAVRKHKHPERGFLL